MITDKLLAEIQEHLIQESPRECCGLIAKKHKEVKYFPCTNIATNIEDFIIDPEEVAYIEDTNWELVYIVHSHPNTDCQPSSSDLLGIEEHRIPWIIMDSNKNISINYPEKTETYSLPLEGREFKYGELDCLTLVQDYYWQKLNKPSLPVLKRISKNWWSEYGHIFESIYTQMGLVKVDAPQEHDILLMTLNNGTPNHLAIYLGNNKILHHAVNRLSCVENLTNEDYSNICYILRRKEYL